MFDAIGAYFQCRYVVSIEQPDVQISCHPDYSVETVEALSSFDFLAKLESRGVRYQSKYNGVLAYTLALVTGFSPAGGTRREA